MTTLPGLALSTHRHSRIRVVRLPDQNRRIDAAVYGQPPDPPATAALLTHLVRAARAAQTAPTGHSSQSLR